MPADFNALKQDLARRMDGAMETLKKEALRFSFTRCASICSYETTPDHPVELKIRPSPAVM